MIKIINSPKGFIMLCEYQDEAHRARPMIPELEEATGAKWVAIGGVDIGKIDEIEKLRDQVANLDKEMTWAREWIKEIVAKTRSTP